MAVDPLPLQIFDELDQAGSLLAKETLEDGLPVHDGKGDVRKCPYYTAKDKGRSCLCPAPSPGWVCWHPPTDGSHWCCHAGALEASSCPFRTALAVLSKPGLQFILAAGVALAAGLLAWYYM